jgi:hypothetical protein
MSTVLTFGLVLRTDAANCLASAVAEIHSSERCLVRPARSHRVSSRCCLHALCMALTARHAPDLKSRKLIEDGPEVTRVLDLVRDACTVLRTI